MSAAARRFDEALDAIDRVLPLAGPRERRTLDVWRAEVLARADRPDEAARAYRDLTAGGTAGDRAQLALDAAETLIDNDHAEAALDFLQEAVELAGPVGLRGVGRFCHQETSFSRTPSRSVPLSES